MALCCQCDNGRLNEPQHLVLHPPSIGLFCRIDFIAGFE